MSSKSERAKLALVPVLIAVLGYCLIDPGGEEPVAAELTSDRKSEADDSDTVTDKHQPKWPSRSLREVASHNPFVLNDPRATLDAAFNEYGLLSEARLVETSHEEFFAKEIAEREQEIYFENLYEELAATNFEPAPDPDGDLQESEEVVVAQPIEKANPDVKTPGETEHAERVRDMARRLAELQKLPVTMIMQSRRGRSALLGNRRVSEGESVEPGIRVISIDGSGVTFAIEETQASASKSTRIRK